MAKYSGLHLIIAVTTELLRLSSCRLYRMRGIFMQCVYRICIIVVTQCETASRSITDANGVLSVYTSTTCTTR